MTVVFPAVLHAIVLTFNPERDVLQREFAILAPQVDKIWLVDNASNQPLAALLICQTLAGKLESVQMFGNARLGAAQNSDAVQRL